MTCHDAQRRLPRGFGGLNLKTMTTNELLLVLQAEFLRALAHPARIRILASLREGEQTVSQLQSLLQVEGSGVSQHLSILRSKNIVEWRKEGTHVYYRVKDETVYRIFDSVHQILNNQLGDLQSVMLAQPGPSVPPTPPVNSREEVGR
jgi:DNA-binding transcriptional ArsR family regulator